VPGRSPQFAVARALAPGTCRARGCVRLRRRGASCVPTGRAPAVQVRDIEWHLPARLNSAGLEHRLFTSPPTEPGAVPITSMRHPAAPATTAGLPNPDHGAPATWAARRTPPKHGKGLYPLRTRRGYRPFVRTASPQPFPQASLRDQLRCQPGLPTLLGRHIPVRGSGELSEQPRDEAGPEVRLGIVPGVEPHMAHRCVRQRIVRPGRHFNLLLQQVEEMALALTPVPEQPHRQGRRRRARRDQLCYRGCVVSAVQLVCSGGGVRPVWRQEPGQGTIDDDLPRSDPLAAPGEQRRSVAHLPPDSPADRGCVASQRLPQCCAPGRVPEPYRVIVASRCQDRLTVDGAPSSPPHRVGVADQPTNCRRPSSGIEEVHNPAVTPGRQDRLTGDG